jgi:hypothetical protein
VGGREAGVAAPPCSARASIRPLAPAAREAASASGGILHGARPLEVGMGTIEQIRLLLFFVYCELENIVDFGI